MNDCVLDAINGYRVLVAGRSGVYCMSDLVMIDR